MRKVVILVALGLILLGLAAWLLFPNVRSDILQRFLGGEPSAITLTYAGIWEPRETIQPLLDLYQQEHPNVTIEYEERDPSEYIEILNAKLGVEGGPDIVRLHSSWVPSFQEKLAPIPGSIMSTSEYEQTFYPVNSVFSKIDDKYYAIPLMVDGLALVYNKELFAESGISTPPQDWEEFRSDSRLLTKRNSRGEIIQAGVAMGYADNIDYFLDIIGLLFAQNGVQFADSTGNVTFHKSISPIGGNLGVEAMRFYTLFSSTEQSWNPTWGNSTKEFTAGRVGMVFLPSHRIHEILNNAPDFPIGVAPVPQLPVSSSAQGRVAWANYWVEAVSSTASNKKEAWMFLKWLAEKDQLTTMYSVTKNIRAFGEPYSRVDLGSALSADSYTLPYVQQGSIYTTWYFTSGVTHAKLNDPIEAALKEMVNNINNGSGIEGELSTAAGTVQEILDSNLR